MGHRAQFVVVRDGRQRRYYDQWAALFVHRELIWGPEETDRWLQKMTEMDEGDWMGAGDAEGGALVDLDARRLVWFGVEESLAVPRVRRLHGRLLAAAWQGFQVSHADRGLADVAEALGESDQLESFDDDYRPETLADVVHEEEEDADWEEDEEDSDEGDEPDDVIAWVTVREADGNTRHWHLETLPLELLTGGEPALAKLRELPSAEVPPESRVMEGVWFDVAQQKVGLWGSAGLRRRLDEVTESLGPWTTNWSEEGYSEHAQSCGVAGVPLSDAQALGKVVPLLLSTEVFNLGTLAGAIGGGINRFITKGAGCLIVVVLLLFGLTGLLTGQWKAMGTAALVFVGAIVLATLGITFAINAKVKSFAGGGREPIPVPGPQEEDARRAGLETLLAAAGLPTLEQIEPYFEADDCLDGLK